MKGILECKLLGEVGVDTDQKRGLGARGAAALNASLALDGAVVMVSETNRKVSLVISGQILAVATAQELFASLLSVMVSSERRR